MLNEGILDQKTPVAKDGGSGEWEDDQKKDDWTSVSQLDLRKDHRSASERSSWPWKPDASLKKEMSSFLIIVRFRGVYLPVGIPAPIIAPKSWADLDAEREL